MSDLRPHELRLMLEDEVRQMYDQTRALEQAVDPMLLVGTVLAKHQHRPDVQRRLEFLWTYLEAYVALLAALALETT